MKFRTTRRSRRRGRRRACVAALAIADEFDEGQIKIAAQSR